MADTKISALTALTASEVEQDDVLAIVDTSTTSTKKIAVSDLSLAVLPTVSGNSGYVLTVNAEGTGVDWQPAQSFGAPETFILSM